ncbi:MAG TPA: hypothetical protein P5318_03865 [Candidatus Hydrogenedentes bacterium]|nr:hypothetical protein [Candidatus Hydrogenedentota bacterium]HPC15285.1 hypothetical protein [Candidatus Hydrogenedentota bacterium]HRT19240.1 hypothetical protein [Candidatus Hydrogenedentota bacterium]HRT63320.1 hypothetical protein [Candidatus Hydrogenedentota bacterium]
MLELDGSEPLAIIASLDILGHLPLIHAAIRKQRIQLDCRLAVRLEIEGIGIEFHRHWDGQIDIIEFFQSVRAGLGEIQLVVIADEDLDRDDLPVGSLPRGRQIDDTAYEQLRVVADGRVARVFLFLRLALPLGHPHVVAADADMNDVNRRIHVQAVRQTFHVRVIVAVPRRKSIRRWNAAAVVLGPTLRRRASQRRIRTVNLVYVRPIIVIENLLIRAGFPRPLRPTVAHEQDTPYRVRIRCRQQAGQQYQRRPHSHPHAPVSAFIHVCHPGFPFADCTLV